MRWAVAQKGWAGGREPGLWVAIWVCRGRCWVWYGEQRGAVRCGVDSSESCHHIADPVHSSASLSYSPSTASSCVSPPPLPLPRRPRTVSRKKHPLHAPLPCISPVSSTGLHPQYQSQPQYQPQPQPAQPQRRKNQPLPVPSIARALSRARKQRRAMFRRYLTENGGAPCHDMPRWMAAGFGAAWGWAGLGRVGPGQGQGQERERDGKGQGRGSKSERRRWAVGTHTRARTYARIRRGTCM